MPALEIRVPAADIDTLISPSTNSSKSPALPPSEPLSPVSTDANAVSTGITLDDSTSLLMEACMNANIVGIGLNDEGKFAKKLTEMKDSFLDRKADFEKYRVHDSILSKSLYELHMTLYRLNEKMKKLKVSSFTIAPVKRRKLDTKFFDVHECWNNILVLLSISIANKSSQAATQATGNITKIAIATGHPDWNILDANDAIKLCTQGDKYLFGYGVGKSPDIALKRYLVAAKYGYHPACLMVAYMQENGIGTSCDLPNAIFWYKTAAEKGSPEACTAIGRIYEEGIGIERDIKVAVEWYLKGADAGELEAMTCLGNILENGPEPIQADPKKAFSWYSLASNNSYARAQNCLGSLYYRGIGCTQDNLKAVTWFRKAAEQGNPAAMNNLGICYEEGKGVAKDYVLAKQWYKASSEKGHASGTNNLGYMYLLEKNCFEAFRLFHLAMSLGSTDAIFNLGFLYETGLSLQQAAQVESSMDTAPSSVPFSITADAHTAFKYFHLAASQKHEKARLKIAEWYLHGRGCAKNLKLASHYYLLAAENGSGVAQNAIGELHEVGVLAGTPNPTEAKKWYLRAMKNGEGKAIFNLAQLYECGSGVEKDLDKAVKLYTEASKKGILDAKRRLQNLREMVSVYETSRAKSLNL